MKNTLAWLTIVFMANTCFAETVTTTDGRTIRLNEDGTYLDVTPPASKADDYLEVWAPLFKRHTSEFQQQSIRFMPTFLNKTDKTIVGIKFTSTFKDAFGDEIFRFDGQVSERIKAHGLSTTTIFYVFENNQFINGEPYDKLLPKIEGKTGSIETVVRKIAFDGGDVMDFTEMNASPIARE